MAWTAITAAMTDADSPLDQTLMDRIRTNDADHETRLNAIEAFSSQDIRDDFISGTTTVDGVIWDTANAGGGTLPDIVSEHQCRMQATGVAGYSNISATTERMHIDMTEEYVVIMEFRIKNPGDDADDIFVGFQDVAIPVASAMSTDLTDVIGIARSPAGGDWDIWIDNGGALGASVRPDQGTQAVWTKFKFTVTCSVAPANRKVEIDVDDASSGAAITTNLPAAVVLRPVAGVYESAADALDIRLDYYLCYFSGRPLAV